MAAVETVAGALSGVAAAVAAGWLGRKRARGKVRDTEAETLWTQLSAELAAVRAEVAAYRAENVALRAALDEANRKAQLAHDDADRLRARVNHLEAELDRVKREQKNSH